MKKNSFFAVLTVLCVTVSLFASSCNGTEQAETKETQYAAETIDFVENEEPLNIEFSEGTESCYTVSGTTVTFNEIQEDSVYRISGGFDGNIVIDVGDECKFELELCGLVLKSDKESPIVILSGDEVSITAKNGYDNYIYDIREAVGEDEEKYSASVYSFVDLDIGGKGNLNVISQNNNGIHTKDDLTVKKLNLNVECYDNALKGNDSVTVESGNIKLIAKAGDGIKTENSDISDKGNQKGDISFFGGNVDIYAACDGIDASHDVIIDGADTVLNIYTDKYSEYSKEVTAVSDSEYYIRFTSKDYKYSVKFYNSDTDFIWVNAEYHSSVSGGRSSYYYYSLPKNTGYEKVQFFIYSSTQQQGQQDDYLVASELMTWNSAYDTFALTQGWDSLSYSWTNYTTTVNEGFGRPGGMGGPGGPGGFGGMGEGNTDKGDYSTKGIKSANEITVIAGKITVKSYDDAMHTNNTEILENGNTPTGNVNIKGGELNLYSNDDGIHADGYLTVSGGNVTVENSYEGMEGSKVSISNGAVSVISSDDGINSTAASGEGIEINGGVVYVLSSGDGIDANTRTSYSGIVFGGGNTIIISTSGGNSAIDTEQGYTYNGGKVLALMPSNGMTNEATQCSNFNSVATKKNISLSEGNYLSVTADSTNILILKMPRSLSACVIYIADSKASFSSLKESNDVLDRNGVFWN